MRDLVVDLCDYRPTPTQDRFLRSEARFAAFFGGYGGGKTRAGAEKALRLALANPGCAGQLVAPTWSMLHRLSLRAFLDAIPAELIAERHLSERYIKLVNGAVVHFGSADHPQALEGTNLAWFWLDEARLATADAWQVLVARLRDKRARQLQGLVTTTPALGWLSEFFDRGLPDRAAFHGSTRENAEHLAPGYIDQLEQTCSARLCRSIIDGEFSVIEGQVFESFDEKRHVIDWQVDRTLRTTAWLDFGVRHGAVLFAQETGDWPCFIDGRAEPLPPHSLVVFDELQPEQRPTDRVIPMMREVLQRHGLRDLAAIYCDPAGRARSIDAGMTSVHLLQAAFGRVVRYQTGADYTWIPNGIAAVDGILSPLNGPPRLYVSRRLLERTGRERDNDFSRGLIKSLRGLCYAEGSDHPIKDGFYEHCADALRYGVVNSLVAAGQSLAGGHINVIHGGS